MITYDALFIGGQEYLETKAIALPTGLKGFEAMKHYTHTKTVTISTLAQ